MDLTKLKELIKYIAVKSSDDIFFGRTKLFKLVFFSDFNHYRHYGYSITGESYHKEPNGPVSNHAKKALNELISAGSIIEQRFDVYGRDQMKPICNAEPDLGRFSKEEILSIEDVLDSYKSMTASRLSDLSHDVVPAWDQRDLGEEIPLSVSLMAPIDDDDDIEAVGKDVLNKLRSNKIRADAVSSRI